MVKEKEFKEMLRLAKQNLELAIHENQAFYPRPYEMICYNCQQSAEKNLKAFLIKNGIQYRRTHDLEFLNGTCETIDEDFEGIFDDCETLNDYGIMPKYPHELYIDDLVVEKAILSAKSIERFVYKKLDLAEQVYTTPKVDSDIKQAIFVMLEAKIPLDSIRKIAKISKEQFDEVLYEYDEESEQNLI